MFRSASLLSSSSQSYSKAYWFPFSFPECGKGFRYKVSYKSHKCSGTLVRNQPSDLIQKLMQNSSILPTSTIVSNETTVNNPNHNQHNHINISNGLTHDGNNELCLDDLLREPYEVLKSNSSDGVGGGGDAQLIPFYHDDGNQNVTAFNDNNNIAINTSYGEILMADNNNQHHQHHHLVGLVANNFTNYPQTLETINEESIKELLFGSVG